MTPRATRGRRRIGAAKAALLALGALVPSLGLLVHVIAEQSLATSLDAFEKLLIAMVFSALPALVVFASIGARLASRADSQSLLRSVRIGATKGALVSLGLQLLVAIPTGALPHSLTGWLPLLLAGGAAGGVVGAVAGFWICHRHAPRNGPQTGAQPRDTVDPC